LYNNSNFTSTGKTLEFEVLTVEFVSYVADISANNSTVTFTVTVKP